jgi:cell wall-associated NlpC family hydrolase
MVTAVCSFFAPDLSAAPKKRSAKISKMKSKGKSKGKKGKKGKRGHKETRHYNPELTREQATEIIRNNSSFISELAGIEPKTSGHTLDGELIDSVILQEGENIAELEREDDVPVDLDNMETVRFLLNAYTGTSGLSDLTESGIHKKVLMDKIMEWVGTPYHFGGMNSNGIDCSAFVQYIFYKSGSIILPRTARDQCEIGMRIDRGELEFGDMIFFHTYSKVFASHVGIYLGDNLFAHASSRYGVTVSSLESTYYATRFIGGRRLSIHDMDRLTVGESDNQSEQ